MTRFVGLALLFGALAGLGGGPGVVLASTITGTAVQISGLEDLSATADTQARKGIGRILAYGAMMAGVGGLISGHYILGTVGLGGGIGMGFIPGIVNSSFDAAPAATGDWLSPAVSSAWWAPCTILLYPFLLLMRFLQDPVYLASFLFVVVLARIIRNMEFSPPSS